MVSSIEKYVRAANYLSVGQLFLQDNFLLERPLTFDDIKPRLLGHWGTCPGINFIYANLNYFIKKHQQSTLFILGPGHGFPALQANLFLEGTLEKYYPQATQTESGIAYLLKNFSWPYGFPSHTFPGTPGSIVEGGELGYALSTAYGATLDNKNLLVACIVGDGEAETGPTAGAWHLNKFINPLRDGTVLPILHLNGYKISGPTIFGRMSNKELKALFIGYGYQPLIVEGANIYQKMVNALEIAYKLIQEIKTSAKQKEQFYHVPMIILKTPKGWTGPKIFNGQKLEGNNLSHQIIFKNARTDRKELRALEKWLHSYHFDQLFNPETGFDKDILSILPEPELRMGTNSHAYSGKVYAPLNMPDVRQCHEDANMPGTIGSSSMRRAGCYLKLVFENNNNIRLFSPDEIYSNKLDEILACTPRQFELPLKAWDKDVDIHGKVIEMLSEHNLQGMAAGYILTGRHALFASYEAFIEIINSMAAQYIKFIKVARQFAWRGDYASFNYILTSSGWRQEHNGFSHQNPGFAGAMLEKHGAFVKAYYPPDGNSMLVALKQCLESKNGINIITAGKTVEPRWLTIDLAEKELNQELMIWDFASDANPDIVFAGIGDYVTKEALAALKLIKTDLPRVKVRFVNVMVLSGFGPHNKLQSPEFDIYFTPNKPVIFNYHGYPETIKALLFDQKNTERFQVHGYVEEGSTTTPFDMLIRNKTDRYNVAIKALELLEKQNIITAQEMHTLQKKYQQILHEHTRYIKTYGIDPQEIREWKWTVITS